MFADEATTLVVETPPGADLRCTTAEAYRIDRYELRELIGRGGMGSVYRAIDTKLGRKVAVKTMLVSEPKMGPSPDARRRFVREALALSRIAHRNVVQVLDFGVTGRGVPFLVMEHLRGRDLGAVLAGTGDALEVSFVADVMLGVCAGLRACHRVGIVHRDLKPSNIFLCETDTGCEVKLLDFGVSKLLTADDLTQDGQLLGTPQYLAPEQIRGEIGPKTDQYAVGVLAYACLTGRLPYTGHRDQSLLDAILRGAFPPLRDLRPDLPDSIERIVKRAMAVSPAARFDSVHALGQALWALATARAQAEWRSCYFGGERTRAAPPIDQHGPAVERTAVGIAADSIDLAARPDQTTEVALDGAGHRLSRVRSRGGRAALTRAWRQTRRAAAVAAAAALLTTIAGAAERSTSRPVPPWRSVDTMASVSRGLEPAPAAPSAPSPPPPIVVQLASPPSTSLEDRVPAPAARSPSHLPRRGRRARSSQRPRLRFREPGSVTDAPFATALPNIDQTGIGIPAD
jgi:eukaryotic-like serine/threonine-protein kinase